MLRISLDPPAKRFSPHGLWGKARFFSLESSLLHFCCCAQGAALIAIGIRLACAFERHLVL